MSLYISSGAQRYLTLDCEQENCKGSVGNFENEVPWCRQGEEGESADTQERVRSTQNERDRHHRRVHREDERSGQFREVRETMEDATLVKKLFVSVPSQYLQVVASLEQLLDVDEMPFKEAIGCLKAYEERVRKDDRQGDQLLLTREEWAAREKKSSGEHLKQFSSSSEGRGWCRGRGRGWCENSCTLIL